MCALKFVESEITVIAAAMELEMAPFLAASEVSSSLSVHGQDFHIATFSDRPVMLVRSGIGLVQAAAAAVRALAFCEAEGVKVTRYICAGTCGGLAPEVSVRNVLVGTSFTYLHADATAFGYELGQVPGQPAVFSDPSLKFPKIVSLGPDQSIIWGPVGSSDAFVTAANVEDMRERFPEVLAVDMESTAAAQVCFAAEVPFQSVRGVSDLCGPTADRDFHVDSEEAALISCNMVQALLQTA